MDEHSPSGREQPARPEYRTMTATTIVDRLASGAPAMRLASSCAIASIDAEMIGETVTIAGLITDATERTTVILHDASGAIRLFFPSGALTLSHAQSGSSRLDGIGQDDNQWLTLLEDSWVIVMGEVQADNDRAAIMCAQIESFDLDTALAELADPIATGPRPRPSRSDLRDVTGAE